MNAPEKTLLEELTADCNSGDLETIYMPDVKRVHRTVVSEHRWHKRVFEVYGRGDEIVGVEYDEPATEIQEGQDLNGRAFPCEAREVVVTTYVEVIAAEDEEE